MDLNIATKICEAANDLALDGFEVRENYTGRGRSNETAAIVFDSMNGLMAAAVHATHMDITTEDDDSIGDDIVDSVLDWAFDNMGRSQIAY